MIATGICRIFGRGVRFRRRVYTEEKQVHPTPIIQRPRSVRETENRKQRRNRLVLIDPYKSILSELIGHQTQTILFQITFRPAPFDWTDGYGPFDPSAERVAEFLEEGRFVDSYFNPRIIDPTEKDKRTAKHIEDLEESQAFEINIRYFVTGQSRKKAIRKAEGIENIVSSVYQNNKVAQQLEATRFDEEEVKDGLATASRREITRNDTIVTKSELAALAHLPERNHRKVERRLCGDGRWVKGTGQCLTDNERWSDRRLGEPPN